MPISSPVPVPRVGEPSLTTAWRFLACRSHGWPDGHPRHRRINDTPAPMSKVLLEAESPGEDQGVQQGFREAGGWGPKPPSGPRPMAPERAAPSGRPAVGCRCSRPSAASGGRQRGAPPRDALLGRTRRRSEGGARCAARATRPRPAGQNTTASRSEGRRGVRGRARPKRRFTRGAKQEAATKWTMKAAIGGGGEPLRATHFPALSFARSASTWPACVPGFTSL